MFPFSYGLNNQSLGGIPLTTDHVIPNAVSIEVDDILRVLGTFDGQTFVYMNNAIAAANKDKTSEIIVVAPTDFLFDEGRLHFQGVETSMSAMSEILARYGTTAKFMRRGTAEEDPSFKQMIPYSVVTKYEGSTTKVFVYERLSGGGEARLHGKLSVGVGGHMNTIFGYEDVALVIAEESEREINEELNIQFAENSDGKDDGEAEIWSASLNVLGLINDDEDAVGKVHLGVLMEMSILDDTVEVSVNETDQLRGGWMTLDELMAPENFDRLESWSKFAVQAIKVKA